MVWQPNILNNCYELSGGYAPYEPPTRGSAPGPRWGTSVPQTITICSDVVYWGEGIILVDGNLPVELSLDISSQGRTRCTVTTAAYDTHSCSQFSRLV